MEFEKAKTTITKCFDDNNFEELLKRKSKITKEIDTCGGGSTISIRFPGYKTGYRHGKLIRDYRVDTTKGDRTFALSHVNIVVDIYNKIVNGGADPQLLTDLIIYGFEEQHTDIIGYADALRYNPVNPPPELRAHLHDIHARIPVPAGKPPKKYNEPGNLEDLTAGELFVSIKYIAGQEDINYPIRRNDKGEIK